MNFVIIKEGKTMYLKLSNLKLDNKIKIGIIVGEELLVESRYSLKQIV